MQGAHLYGTFQLSPMVSKLPNSEAEVTNVFLSIYVGSCMPYKPEHDGGPRVLFLFLH